MEGEKNKLAIKNPGLTKEWHSTKNKDLTPDMVTMDSKKKFWWQCEREHEWKSTIANRTSGTDCPTCYKAKVNMEKIKVDKINISNSAQRLAESFELGKTYFLDGSWGSGKTEYLNTSKNVAIFTSGGMVKKGKNQR